MCIEQVTAYLTRREIMPAEIGKELVNAVLTQLNGLDGASEKAVAQLENESARLFNQSDENAMSAFAQATTINEFEEVVQGFKAGVLSTITNERHKKAVLRSRISEKTKSMVDALRQGMTQELQLQLDKERRKTKELEASIARTKDSMRTAKDIEVRDAIARALADMGNGDGGAYLEAVNLHYDQQLMLMKMLAKAWPKKYTPDVVGGWRMTQLAGEASECQAAVTKRHRELAVMANDAVESLAEAKDARRLQAELDAERKRTADLQQSMMEMQVGPCAPRRSIST